MQRVVCYLVGVKVTFVPHDAGHANKRSMVSTMADCVLQLLQALNSVVATAAAATLHCSIGMVLGSCFLTSEGGQKLAVLIKMVASCKLCE